MIRYMLLENEGCIGLRVVGHAEGNIKSGRYDLLCCAVSAIAQTALNGCVSETETDVHSAKKGNLCYVSEKTEASRAITESAYQALVNLELQYPNDIQHFER